MYRPVRDYGEQPLADTGGYYRLLYRNPKSPTANGFGRLPSHWPIHLRVSSDDPVQHTQYAH